MGRDFANLVRAIALTSVLSPWSTSAAERDIFYRVPGDVFGPPAASGHADAGGSGTGGSPTPGCSIRIELDAGSSPWRTEMGNVVMAHVVPDGSEPLPSGGTYSMTPSASSTGISVYAVEDAFYVFAVTPGTYDLDVAYAPPAGSDAFVPCAASQEVEVLWAETERENIRSCTDETFRFAGMDPSFGTTAQAFRPLPAGFSIDDYGVVTGRTTAPVGTLISDRNFFAVSNPYYVSPTRVFDMVVVPSHRIEFQSVPSVGGVNQDLNVYFHGAGGPDGSTYEFDPPLPSWLAFDPSPENGYFYKYYGRPTQPGSWTTTATIRNGCGLVQDARQVSIVVE